MKRIELYTIFMVGARITDKNIQIAQMDMSEFVHNASPGQAVRPCTVLKQKKGGTNQ